MDRLSPDVDPYSRRNLQRWLAEQIHVADRNVRAETLRHQLLVRTLEMLTKEDDHAPE